MSNDIRREIVNISMFGGPVYVGRKKGQAARKRLGLDNIDKTDRLLEIVVPDDTYAMNSSFFLGMFGDSIRHLGTRELFLDKYRFTCAPVLLEVIERGIVRALQRNASIV